MLYTMGDSHCDFTFNGIPGISINRIGPVTLKRMGYLEDTLLPSSIKKLNLNSKDILILCFGEIDVRCWVKVYVPKYKDLDSLLQDWVSRYISRISTLDTNGARIAVLSVVPPARGEIIYQNENFPVNGNDTERSEYARKINELLQTYCKNYNLLYLDVYSRYKNNEGMIIEEKSDKQVHILDNSEVHKLLIELGWL